jgi:hypothetical protein
VDAQLAVREDRVMAEQPLSAREFGTAFKGFLEQATSAAAPEESVFAQRLRDHFGCDPLALTIVGQEFPPTDRPNVQIALDELLVGVGYEVLGFNAAYSGMGGQTLTSLVAPPVRGMGTAVSVAPVRYVHVPVGGDDVVACLDSALILHEGPLAVFVASAPRNGPFGGTITVQVSAEDRERADAFLAELRTTIREKNVYRGRVISFETDRTNGQQIAFHELPRIDREAIILPAGVLERVERHTVAFARHADRLAAAGRHLRRGLLLHGPPGTGKTMTATYIVGQLGGRTVILLTGRSLGLIEQSVAMARMLAPSMVVLEDVDLVAEERTQQGVGTNAVLFELLNQMDGLTEDADIVFLLTTNRPELLEPALASRPGRIDQAVEIPLPDADGRRRLLALYSEGLTVELADPESLVERTDGVSAAFVRELLRKAALNAADEQPGEIVVRDAHLESALRDLLIEGGELTKALLGGGTTSSGATRPPS